MVEGPTCLIPDIAFMTIPFWRKRSAWNLTKPRRRQRSGDGPPACHEPTWDEWAMVINQLWLWHLSVYKCVPVYMYIYTYICIMCIYIYIYTYIYIYIYICIMYYIYICICICIYIYIYIYDYIGECLSLFVCGGQKLVLK